MVTLLHIVLSLFLKNTKHKMIHIYLGNKIYSTENMHVIDFT